MADRAFDAARPIADAILESLCSEAQTLISGPEFGGRIWVLPRWYLVAKYRNPDSLRLVYVEVIKRVTRRPTMYRLATRPGFTNRSSKVTWTIGKGLPGYLTEGESAFDIVQHATAWPANVDDMSEKEWNALDVSVTRSRSLKDVLALRNLYATALGVPLADPDSKAALGCVILHTKAGEPLTKDQADKVIAHVTMKVPGLARQVVSAAGLKLTR
jgi:hypothetical protein